MDRYRIISKLGEGGYGEVYRAWDNRLGRPVVLKMPLRAHLGKAAILERFAREISKLDNLDHPHIVPMIDHGADSNGRPYFVMRFLPGGSLDDRQKPSPVQALHRWLPAIAEALDYVHARGVVHRDVKPTNIFFDTHANAFLGDFGIAKIADEFEWGDQEDTLTRTGGAVGTYPFMAPEFFRKPRVLSGAYDQYALAITVYEVVAGRRPFGGDSGQLIAAHLMETPEPLSERVNGVPRALSDAVQRALAKSPGERFRTCVEFAQHALDGIPVPGLDKSYFRFLCPGCKRLVRVPEDRAGQNCRCPGCNVALRVSEGLDALWKRDEAPSTDERSDAFLTRPVRTPLTPQVSTTPSLQPWLDLPLPTDSPYTAPRFSVLPNASAERQDLAFTGVPPVATDGTRPEMWMVDECRRQALLYLVHASHAVANGTVGMPEPLLSGESRARLRLREEAANVRGTRSGIEVITQHLKILFPADDSGQAGVPDGWSYAELVGWWIQAGEAVRGWHQKDARQYALLVSPEGGGLYPPFWCASRFERLRFSFDSWQQAALLSAGIPGHDWRGVGKTQRDHRLKLLKWVMQPRRPRPPGRPDPARQSQEWLQSLRQEFASVLQDAEELFGSEWGLESGGPLTHETVRDWIPVWHAGQFPGGLVQEVRQPVMQSGGDRATLVKGISVLPPASFIVRRITSSGATGGSAVAGWRAALEFAAGCWGIPKRLHAAAVPPPLGAWKQADDGKAAMLNPSDLDSGLIAVARLLVATTTDQNQQSVVGNADDTGRADPDALRATLAFEGFLLQSAPGRGAVTGRMIPQGGPGPADGVLQLTLRVLLPNPSGSPVACDVDLGTIGSAAACCESLLAAIEAVDWRLWALEKAPFPKDVSRRRNLILETVNHRAWESVKAPVLARAGEAADIVRLFEHVHRARLGLATFLAAGDDAADQDLGGSLLHDLDALRRVTLSEAVAIDPRALERCWPPRKGDGAVNVVRWLMQRLTSEADHDEAILDWWTGTSFGMPVADERVDEQGRLVVTVSAGPVGEDEIRCLNMPLPAANTAAVTGAGGRPLRTVIAVFQGRLIESLSKSTPHALDSELSVLRSRLAGADAAAFHELVERASTGDAAAVAWLDFLGTAINDQPLPVDDLPQIPPFSVNYKPLEALSPAVTVTHTHFTWTIESAGHSEVSSRNPASVHDSADQPIVRPVTKNASQRARARRRGFDAGFAGMVYISLGILFISAYVVMLSNSIRPPFILFLAGTGLVVRGCNLWFW